MNKYQTSETPTRLSNLLFPRCLKPQAALKYGGCVFAFFFALAAEAQTNYVSAPLVAPALPDAGVSLLRVMGALALVIGIFLGGVWFVKNWQRLAVQRGR